MATTWTPPSVQYIPNQVRIEWRYLDEIIKELAAMETDANGNMFDWGVNEDREFYLKAPTTSPNRWYVAGAKIKYFDANIDGSTIRNKIYAVGTPGDNGMPITYEFVDTNSQTIYELIEGISSVPAITDYTDLTQIGLSILGRTSWHKEGGGLRIDGGDPDVRAGDFASIRAIPGVYFPVEKSIISVENVWDGTGLTTTLQLDLPAPNLGQIMAGFAGQAVGTAWASAKNQPNTGLAPMGNFARSFDLSPVAGELSVSVASGSGIIAGKVFHFSDSTNVSLSADARNFIHLRRDGIFSSSTAYGDLPTGSVLVGFVDTNSNSCTAKQEFTRGAGSHREIIEIAKRNQFRIDNLQRNYFDMLLELEGFIASSSDEYVKITSNDTTPGYLKDKLQASTSINLIELNDGGNEVLAIETAQDIATPATPTFEGLILNSGGLSINNSSSHIDLIETDASYKTWRIEGQASCFKVYEISASKYGLEINPGGIVNLPYQSGCRVHRNGSVQAITSGSVTKVQYTTEDYDLQGEFDNATNYRFTATKAGRYLVCHNAGIIGLDDGDTMQVSIYKNGAIVNTTQLSTCWMGDSPLINTVCIISLAANDYIEGYVWHNYGSDRNLHGDSYSSALIIGKIA